MYQHAIGETQDDRVGIIGCQKLAIFGRYRNGLALFAFGADEHAAQFRAIVLAFLDAEGHPVAQIGKFADLDRGTERARAQFEAELFIIIAGQGLDESDQRQIDQHQCHREQIGHPQQTTVALAYRPEDIEFRAERELPERQQDAEQQADRNAQRQIFGYQVGQHSPHDADRPSFRGDKIKQPQHFFEHQQHRCNHQCAE